MILISDKNLAKTIKNSRYCSINALSDYQNDKKIEIIIGSRLFVRKSKGLNLPNLKLIQLTSSGFEGIDLDYYSKQNILVCNAGDIYTTTMSEFAVMYVLMNSKKLRLNIFSNFPRLFRKYKYITEIEDKNITILGTGLLSQAIAKRLNGFGCNVFGVSRKPVKNKLYKKIVTWSDSDQILSQSDYILICLPINQSTIGIINEKFLRNLKSNIFILNLGRNSLLNKNDFGAFFKDNKSAFAVLDIFLKNPFLQPYYFYPNIKVIPGLTALSNEIESKKISLFKSNIECILYDKYPKYVINKR